MSGQPQLGDVKMAFITMTSGKSAIKPYSWDNFGEEMVSLRTGDYVTSVVMTKDEARELALNILAICQKTDKEAA